MADYTSYDAGTAYLTVEPRLMDGFRQRVERDLAAMDIDLTVPVNADLSEFRRNIDAELALASQRTVDITTRLDVQAAAFQAQLSALAASSQFSVDVDLNLDASAMQAGLAALASGTGLTIPVNLDVDAGAFQAQLAALAALNNFRIRVGVDPDWSNFPGPPPAPTPNPSPNPNGPTPTPNTTANLDDFQTNLRARIRQMSEETELRIPLDADGEAFRIRLRALVAAAEAGVNADIPVDPQLGAEARARMLAQVESLAAEIRTAMPPVEVPVRPELDAFQANLRSRLEAMQRNAEVNIPLTPDGEDFRQRLRGMVEVATRNLEADVPINPELAAAQRARLVAEIEEIERRIRVHVPVDVDTDRANRGLRDVESNAGRAEKGMRGLGAVKVTGIIAGITALVGEIVGAIGAIGGMAAAFGALGGVAAIGATGMIDTFSAMKEASTSAGQDAQDTARAQRDAAEGVEDAYYDVAEANRAVGDAERDAANAQNTLNDAYRDASRELRDMNDQLKDAELSQEGAAIAVARAREALARAKADPESSKLDIVEAEYRLRSAESRYGQSKTATADLRTDVTEANAKGVMGSDTVVSAQQGLADANQGVLDANRDLEMSLRALRDAEEALADAGESAGSGQDKFAEALANLSPNAQDFVLKMQALGPAWKDARLAIQDNMFDGLGDSITELANNQLPGFTEGMGALATGLNTGLKDTIAGIDSELTSMVDSGLMAEFVNGTASAMQGLEPLVTGLMNSFVQMGATVGPTIAPLLASIGDAFRTMGPALGEIGAVFNQSLTTLMPMLAQFISALATNLAPILPVVADLLGSLFAAIEPALPGLSKITEVIGTALIGAFDALAPAMGPLADTFAAIFEAIGPILPLVAQLISTLVQALAPALTTIANALAPVISTFAEAMGPVLEALQPVIAQIADVFAEVLATALEALVPLMLQMAPLWMEMLQAIIPLLPPILQLVSNLLPPLIQVFMSLMPAITKVMEIMISLVNVIVPILIPAITRISEVVTTVFQSVADIISNVLDNVVTPLFDNLEKLLRNVVGPVFTWLFENIVQPVFSGIGSVIEGVVTGVIEPIFTTLGTAINTVGTFFGDLGETVSSIWDGIVKTIATAVSAIGRMLQTVKIPDWVPGIGGKGATSLGDSMVAWGDAHRRAGGGPIAGPGGPTDDVIPAWLSNGEYVINAASTRKYGPLIEAINNGDLPGFSTGGPVNALQFAQDHPNVPYVWGGTTVNGADCSGWVGLLQQVAMGVDNPTARLGTTYSVLDGSWGGVIDGASPDDAFVIGTNETHMSASILGTNVEARTTGENVRIGDAAASPFDGQFTKQVHVDPAVFHPAYVPDEQGPAMSSDGIAYGPIETDQSALDKKTDSLAAMPGAGSSSTSKTDAATTWSGLAGGVADAFVSGMVGDALGVFGIPDSLPPIVQAVRDYKSDAQIAAEDAADTTGTGTAASPATPTPAVPTVPSTANPEAGGNHNQQNPFAHDYDPSQGAEQWAGVLDAVFDLGGWDKANIPRTIEQVDIESGGDPNALNDWDINAQNGTPSQGLLQTIPLTFNAFKSNALLDSITDPANNLFAGINYVETDPKFGGVGMAGVWPTRNGYAQGGSVWGRGGPKADMIPALLSDREFVMNAQSADANRPLLEAMNADANVLNNTFAPLHSLSDQSYGGNQTHVDNSMVVNLTTPDTDSAFSRAKTWEAQRSLTYTSRR